MKEAAKLLEFEHAAFLRDQIDRLRRGENPTVDSTAERSASRTMHRHREEGESTLANDKIVIKGRTGAQPEKHRSWTLPREKLIVMTGLSGSGKLQPGVRYHLRRRPAPLRREPVQLCPACFLGQMDKPDVDEIDRAVAGHLHRPEDHQPKTRAPPWARSRKSTIICACCTRASACPHCPVCGREISQQTVDQMVDADAEAAGGHALSGAGPGGARSARATQQKEFDAARRSGYVARAGGRQPLRSGRGDHAGKEQQAHHGDRGGPPCDRARTSRRRLADSLETALQRSRAASSSSMSSAARSMTCSARTTPARSTAFPSSELSPRACSRSTTRWAPAQSARAWALSCRWTRTSSCPTRSFPSGEGAIKASGWYYAEGSIG